MSKRYIHNKKIIKMLEKEIEKHPDWRFIQLLWNVGVITRNEKMQILDRFYEESEETEKIIEIMSK